MTVPWLLVIVIPVVGVTMAVLNRYRATSRELMRIDAQSRSPLYVLVGRCLAFRDTIRSFGGEVNRLFTLVEALLDCSEGFGELQTHDSILRFDPSLRSFASILRWGKSNIVDTSNHVQSLFSVCSMELFVSH